MLCDDFNKDRRTTFRKLNEIVETHHKIKNMKDKKYLEAIKILANKYQDSKNNEDESWQEVLHNTAMQIIDEHYIITSYPDGFTPYRTYIYGDGYYKEDLKYVFIRKEINEILNENATLNPEKEIINKIKTLTLDIKKNLYRDINLIALKNKLFDTHTRTTYKFDPDKFILNKVPVEYNGGLGYSNWFKYINSWTNGNKAYANTLQEFVGYIWYPGQPAKKLLYLDGPRNSGKSLFCYAIENMIGRENVDNLTPDEACSKFDNASLFGKLANIRSDVDTNLKVDNIQRIKSLTGGDTIKVQRKFENPFKLESRAKFIWTGNGPQSIPESAFNDDAVIIRFLPIPFHVIYTDFDYDLVNLDDDEEIKDREKDDVIKKILTSDKMKSEIFNWSLEGARRLSSRNWIFSYNPSIIDIRKWFTSGRVIHNDVEQFLVETMKRSETSYIGKIEMYNTFIKWCKEKEKPILSNNTFHGQVKNNRIFGVTEFYPSSSSGRVHAWRGIIWKKV